MLSRRAVGALLVVAMVVATLNFIALFEIKPSFVYDRLANFPRSEHFLSTTTASVNLKGSSSSSRAESSSNSDKSGAETSTNSESEPSDSQARPDTAMMAPDVALNDDTPRSDDTHLDTNTTGNDNVATAVVTDADDAAAAVVVATDADDTHHGADTTDNAAADAVVTTDTDTIHLDADTTDVAAVADVAATEAADAAKPNDDDAHTRAPEVGDELMTPELIEQIESQRIDPLAPPQVHMIWIGDVNKAPRNHTKYTEHGFKLTVHTDAEEILAGFQPFVLRAYRLALPRVVGFDFLKFALLYKYGGLAVDADTEPAINATELHFPSDCDVVFGKEAPPPRDWEKPVFRQTGGPDYGLIRPFQILNWAMATTAPRNKHIKWLLEAAMMRFFGLRDMEATLIQDISGSGLMTDYVALLHERQGRRYQDVYNDHTGHIPVDRMCLTTAHYHSMWLKHMNLASWKQEAGVR